MFFQSLFADHFWKTAQKAHKIAEKGIRQRIVALTMAVGSIFLPMATTHAAALPYQAQTSPIGVTLAAGEVKTITLSFKNVGTKSWTAGKKATAVYLYGTSSVFGHSSWFTDDMPALIKQTSVKPGATATATFSVRAPLVPGTYTEKFLLSSAPHEWIKGSTLHVTFTVSKPSAITTGTKPSLGTATSAPAVADVITPASTSGYKAQLVDKGGTQWQMNAGEYATVNVKFKNTGTRTWTRDGAEYLSAYTWGPKYRVSPFQGDSWKAKGQAGFLIEPQVKPGETGTIRLIFKAPDVAGSYTETFQLAAENKAWIEGGTVSFPISVIVPASQIAAGNLNTAVSSTVGTYSAVLLLTSSKTVSVPGSERFKLTQGFKNAGTAAWNTRGLRLISVAPTLGLISNVRDESWPSAAEAVKLTDATKPGQIGFLSYTIKAPAKRGDYVASFKLTADGQDVEGGDVQIPITVTSDGVIDPTPIPTPGPVVTSSSSPLPLTGDMATLPEEPIIRVGLYKTTDETLPIRGVQGGITITQNGNKVCHMEQGQIVKITFSRATKVYSIAGPGCTGQSTIWYVVAADDGMAPLEITDYSRPVSWLPGANDNKFRGTLELRFAPATDNVWVINELPLETYLKGIAETSNVSPLEFQKALLTAARTYALYHVRRPTKHAKEFFTVDASLDQVYRGYGQEARSPNIVDGVIKTRGQIVTHEGTLAVTPYFSRSDGRTRDWTEVWGGGAIPWLKSVPVPHDVGQTLWGHGVGMSARGALYMASKDNKLYDEILKHFYVGTELRVAYK